MKILVIGGGRWGNIYIENILESLEIFSNLTITLVSKSNFKLNASKYQSKKVVDVIEETDKSLDQIYDLMIICTPEKFHYLSLDKYKDNAKKILIEKPCFYKRSEFNMYHEYLAIKDNNEYGTLVSCPFVFSNIAFSLSNLLKEKFLKKIIFYWHDPIVNNSDRRYDKFIENTAISHFLPLAIAILNGNKESVTIKERTDNLLGFQLINKNMPILVEIRWERKNNLKRKRLIEIEFENKKPEEKVTIDFDNMMSYGSTWDNNNFGLSPLASQVFYILQQENEIDLNKFINFYFHNYFIDLYTLI